MAVTTDCQGWRRIPEVACPPLTGHRASSPWTLRISGVDALWNNELASGCHGLTKYAWSSPACAFVAKLSERPDYCGHVDVVQRLKPRSLSAHWTDVEKVRPPATALTMP